MYIRHCTAARGHGAWWRYDPVRKIVLIFLPRGSCAIDVCSVSRPRFGAFPVVRANGSTWQIVPARYTTRGVHGELVKTPHSIDPEFGAQFVHLLDAPESVAAELAELE